MTTSNKSNYFYNTFYQILSVLTPLITAPYVSRVLGAEGIGRISFTYSVVSYFVLLATLGSTVLGQRDISYNRNSLRESSIIFWNTCCLRTVTTLVAIIAYFIFVPIIFDNIDKRLCIIQSLYIVNVAADVTWYFQGIADFKTITLRNTIVRIISIISVFLFVRDSGDFNIYALIIVGSTTVGLFLTIPLLYSKICKVNINELNIFATLKKCMPLFVPTVAVQIYTVLDKTMIGLYSVNSIENGYYEQSEKIVKMTIVLITSLSTVLGPKIATAYKMNEFDKINEYLKLLVRYVMFLGLPIAGGLLCISDSFIPMFLGNGYEKCILLMKVFSPIVFFIGLSNVFGTTFCVQTSKQRIVNSAVVFGALINLLLNFFLIPTMASVGASIASVVAEFSVCMYLFSNINKYVNVAVLFKGNIAYVLSSLIMIVITLPMGYYLRQLNNVDFIVVVTQVIVGIVVYIVMLFLLKDKMLLDWLSYLKK